VQLPRVRADLRVGGEGVLELVVVGEEADGIQRGQRELPRALRALGEGEAAPGVVQHRGVAAAGPLPKVFRRWLPDRLAHGREVPPVAARLHPAVAVVRAAADELDAVHHRVAGEEMVPALVVALRKARVRARAYKAAVQVVRDRSVRDSQVHVCVLHAHGRPRTGHERIALCATGRRGPTAPSDGFLSCRRHGAENGRRTSSDLVAVAPRRTPASSASVVKNVQQQRKNANSIYTYIRGSSD
jgi:hypothetical protein